MPSWRWFLERSTGMKAALGQFAVSRDWQENLATCVRLMREAAAARADLLVLPEGILARDITDPDSVLKTAQPLDGPFVSALLDASRAHAVATVFCLHIPTGTGRVFNTQLVI